MRDALSLLLSSGGEPLTVVDGEGRVEGLLTLELRRRLLGATAALAGRSAAAEIGRQRRALAAAGPVIPNFGAQSSQLRSPQPPLLLRTGSRTTGARCCGRRCASTSCSALIAVAIGFVISMALALLAYRYRRLERPTILLTTILYTIPSLALFELLVPSGRARTCSRPRSRSSPTRC